MENGKTLSIRYGRPTAWKEEGSPIVTFWLDNGPECLGFPFFSVAAARYLILEETVSLEWPFGTIMVKGPKALEFFEAFCSHRATGTRADGKDITSVTFVSAGEQPADSD
jgi:hypothetical protein